MKKLVFPLFLTAMIIFLVALAGVGMIRGDGAPWGEIFEEPFVWVAAVLFVLFMGLTIYLGRRTK